MLVDKTEIEVTGQLAGERVEMKFDEDSVSHLMAQFIDLYTDPEMAVIREYSTNALDSHIEAGNSAPIEVTLPSPLSPFLKIKDYGIGMDADTIRDIYSKYGASTKRDSNDFQGQLGLGCKSALTYTHQFTLTGTKDGVMTTVAISRMDNGGGAMTIVNECQTDAPNGVEIIIPAKATSSFETKATKFFRFWNEGTVLVNGKPPVRYEPFLKITDNMALMQEPEPVRVVMGNVAYPVKTEDMDLKLPAGMSAVIFVPMGAVNFTPSREALRMTPKTKATLAKIAEEFDAGRDKAAQKEIAAASNLFEAIEIFKKFKGKISSGNMDFKKFRQREVPAKIEFPNGTVSTASHMRGWGKKSDHWYADGLNLMDWPQSVIIKNWSQSRFTAATKKKLVKWAEQNGFGGYDAKVQISNFYLIPEDFDNKDFDPKHVVDWEVIRAIKLEYKRGNKPKAAGTYDVFVYSENDGEDSWEYGMATDDFPDYPMFYAVYDKNDNNGREIKIMKAHHKEFMIVVATANRIDKFERLYPNANRLTSECAKLAKKFAATVDPVDVAANEAQQYSDISKLQAFGNVVNQIEDPELQRYIRIATRDLKHFKDSANLYGHYLTSSEVYNRKGTSTESEFYHVLDKYPLVDHSYSVHRHVADCVAYFNAMYRARVVDHCAEWN